MAHDPVTGPISREAFRELVQAPAGQARKKIQEYDPFWGREEGAKIDYEVTVSGMIQGTALVKASSQDEADKLADDLNDADIDWGGGSDDFTVLSVAPYKRNI